MFRTFLLSAFLLLAWLSPSYACSRDPSVPEPTDEELFHRASAVFLARIYKTEESMDTYFGRVEPIVIGTYRLIEVFKGQPPADNMVRDPTPGPGNCGLMLMAGLNYIFFLHPESGTFVPWPNGSRAYFTLDAEEPKQLLTRLRSLRK